MRPLARSRGRFPRLDADRLAGLQFPVEVRGVILGQLHEQAAGVADALAGDLADNAVLLDALLGAGRVGLGVPDAAVENAVGAPGGAAPFDERDVDAAQRQVLGDAGSHCASAGDQYRRLLRHLLPLACRPRFTLLVRLARFVSESRLHGGLHLI